MKAIILGMMILPIFSALSAEKPKFNESTIFFDCDQSIQIHRIENNYFLKNKREVSQLKMDSNINAKFWADYWFTLGEETIDLTSDMDLYNQAGEDPAFLEQEGAAKFYYFTTDLPGFEKFDSIKCAPSESYFTLYY